MANYSKQGERRPPTAREKSKRGPPPTLIQELRKGYSWFWFVCPRCQRRTPKALAPFAIRYGFDMPTIDVAKFATCQRCGHAGALLQRPSMQGTGNELMMEPFPLELAMQGLELWSAQAALPRPGPPRQMTR